MMRGTEDIMRTKSHGTCTRAAQQRLRWGCEYETADQICCFNRHYAEPSGYYYSEGRTFVSEMAAAEAPITFYDAVDGRPLFVAPVGRSSKDFLQESYAHGWPSFRQAEVVWENVRCLPDGEVVSTSGTHLGHNIPDEEGHRFCINVSHASHPCVLLHSS